MLPSPKENVIVDTLDTGDGCRLESRSPFCTIVAYHIAEGEDSGCQKLKSTLFGSCESLQVPLSGGKVQIHKR